MGALKVTLYIPVLNKFNQSDLDFIKFVQKHMFSTYMNTILVPQIKVNRYNLLM